MKKVDFMLTAFRDGFQSVFGARVFSSDFLPVVEEAAAAGITHFEAGGGALFQAAYFYSNEDAFRVMDDFRRIAGNNANLQTLARGINVVGLDSQPRDIIKLHAQLMKKHGITTIRNFDALNDVNNLLYSGHCIAEAGLRHEITVTMMELPPGCVGHTVEFYESVLRRILDSGIPYDSLCFKDASGTSTPHKVYETIRMARKLVGEDTRIVFHSHETAGCSVLAYHAALEGGADQLDLSIAPLSGGTCQPDILTMWHALRGTQYDLGVDVKKIIKLEESLKEAMKDYFMPPEATQVNPLIPFFPMPGGALTANTQMLRDNGLMDKYQEVIAAMGEAVAKGGFGTSVTPVSQFYFQQAFSNAMQGRWKVIDKNGYGKMVLGYFGKTPVAPDPEIVKLASEQLGLEPTTEAVVDINNRNPKLGVKYNTELLEKAGLPVTEENIFIVAACGEKGLKYLQGDKPMGIRYKEADKPKAAAAKGGAYTANVDGKNVAVELNAAGDAYTATVNGKSFTVKVSEGIAAATAAAAPAASGAATALPAPLPGTVMKIMVEVGEEVAADDVILVMEAMKMETEVKAPKAGVIREINVSTSQVVAAGDTLVMIEEK